MLEPDNVAAPGMVTLVGPAEMLMLSSAWTYGTNGFYPRHGGAHVHVVR